MSNMSYCRFENTSRDLEDCYEAMSDNSFDINKLSSSEQEAYDCLLSLCKQIVLDFCN